MDVPVTIRLAVSDTVGNHKLETHTTEDTMILQREK